MAIRIIRFTVAALLVTTLAGAQAPSTTPGGAPQTGSNDPFPSPIAATEGVVRVSFVEFATFPTSRDSPRG